MANIGRVPKESYQELKLHRSVRPYLEAAATATANADAALTEYRRLKELGGDDESEPYNRKHEDAVWEAERQQELAGEEIDYQYRLRFLGRFFWVDTRGVGYDGLNTPIGAELAAYLGYSNHKSFLKSFTGGPVTGFEISSPGKFGGYRNSTQQQVHHILDKTQRESDLRDPNSSLSRKLNQLQRGITKQQEKDQQIDQGYRAHKWTGPPTGDPGSDLAFQRYYDDLAKCGNCRRCGGRLVGFNVNKRWVWCHECLQGYRMDTKATKFDGREFLLFYPLHYSCPNCGDINGMPATYRETHPCRSCKTSLTISREGTADYDSVFRKGSAWARNLLRGKRAARLDAARAAVREKNLQIQVAWDERNLPGASSE